MSKTILLTGATDGIGLETAISLAQEGHHLLLHGRNPEKLRKAVEQVGAGGNKPIESYIADMADLQAVRSMAEEISSKTDQLDVLINNAGIYKAGQPLTEDGHDVRFRVNTVAPYLLTRELMPLFGQGSRVVNLSSAAQSDLDLDAVAGLARAQSDMDAYAQSKTGITAWTKAWSAALAGTGPMMVAVNPGSLLASKMVKEGFGVAGKDIGIGVDILKRAALSEEFADAHGRYFDNDSGRFADPHPDAENPELGAKLLQFLEQLTR